MHSVRNILYIVPVIVINDVTENASRNCCVLNINKYDVKLKAHGHNIKFLAKYSRSVTSDVIKTFHIGYSIITARSAKNNMSSVWKIISPACIFIMPDPPSASK